MKTILLLLSIFIYDCAFSQGEKPIVITGKLIRITKPLRDFTSLDKMIPDVKVRDEEGIIGKDESFEEGAEPPRFPSSNMFKEDPALQKDDITYQPQQSVATSSIIHNFDGMPYQPLNPPDPTMCAGTNYIIQMINGASGALFKVYNKSGGQVVAQTYLDAITGKGGLGDPIAIYDQLADRFILTEFANSTETGSEGLIMAITKTNDPAGQWYVYFFSTGTTFPDYPKYAVWTNAYYATSNNFANGSSYSGSNVYAFDKAKMIAGNATAQMQQFTLGSTSKFFSMSPVNLEGKTLPPSGTGGLIAYMQDDSWTSSSADVDSIGLFEFKVDFTNPSNSKISTKVSLATTPYKAAVCYAERGQCITQPGTSIAVEALSEKIMNQPVYRRFGNYEGIVMTHLVDRGSGVAAPRWYELRKSTGNWNIYQQSTYSPDNTHRWMPTVCYNANGDIALAYNVSSSANNVYPGVRYTARNNCDPLNKMTYAEKVIVAGKAANSSTRYGDYNHMVCDPDGVTFWLTTEYNPASTWSTRITSFKLGSCSPVNCGDPAGLTSSSIKTTSATVSWNAVTSALNYDVDYKLTTTSTWTHVATATTSTSVNITGLTQGTKYDWQVRATCSAGSGGYVSAQFTTLTTVTCNAPTGLTASSINGTSATVKWTAVMGALNYDVDYKLITSSNWINKAKGTSATSINLTGLTAGKQYDWRVRTNCAGTNGSSVYSTSRFTTSGGQPVCVTNYEPNETLASAVIIDTNTVISAAINTSTDIDYYKFSLPTTYKIDITLTNLPADYNVYLYDSTGKKLDSSIASGTASETITYNNSDAGTFYVKVIGKNGAKSTSACYNLKVNATFVSNNCAGIYDNLPNNFFSNAVEVPLNTAFKGRIKYAGDSDYYKFSLDNSTNLSIATTVLPKDYDMRLYNSAQVQIASSQNRGTADEHINYNAAAGTYYVKIYGFNNVFSSSNCYTMNVGAQAASGPELVTKGNVERKVEIFPNPAQNLLNIRITGYKESAQVHLFDITGRELLYKNISKATSQMDISTLKQGIYLIRIFNGRDLILNSKIVKD